MASMTETAKQFFDACETGKGWEACKSYCHPGATFSCQAEALSEVDTLEASGDGKHVEADYVYVMEFEGDRIRHMTKIWNDGFSLKQLGWM